MRRAFSFIRTAAIVIGALWLLPSTAVAQVVTDPTGAEFNPSPDHDETFDGMPIVSSYQLELYLSGASTPFQTVSLGKPAVDPDGMIRVDLGPLLIPLPAPGTSYTATVAAVGPGGVGRSTPSNVFLWSGPPPCTYAISPSLQAAGATGGTFTATVDAPSGCAWSATESLSWVSITSGSSGAGDGSVTYSVTANTGTSSRSGSLTIAGETLSLTQSGAGSTCSYSILPASQAAAAGGGTFTATVDTTSGCAWSATESLSWVSISSGASGTGDGSVTYSVTANTSASSRSGSLAIAGQTLSLTQSAGCAYSISPSSQAAGAGGGTFTATVDTASGCMWSATESLSWVSITSGGTGTGDGSVGYSVSANTNTSSRSGSLTIAGQTLSLTQAGGAGCVYSIAPPSHSLPAAAGTATVAVTTAAGCSWTATDNRTWITITSGTSGNGNGVVTFSVTANTGTTSRSGSLTIGGTSVNVTQGVPTALPPAPNNLRVLP